MRAKICFNNNRIQGKDLFTCKMHLQPQWLRLLSRGSVVGDSLFIVTHIALFIRACFVM